MSFKRRTPRQEECIMPMSVVTFSKNTDEIEYNVGDIVPYKNSRGNIKLAKIASFQTVDNGKIWFNGFDTVTNAKVWYPVHISKSLKSNYR